tara:strand:+ start:101 stop:361 length:261 start_codon:yes stop_codon:yes gene_type:complete
VTDLPTAGTAVQLAGHTTSGYLIVQGHPSNAGDVFIGPAGVTNAGGARCGLRLTPGGAPLTLRLGDANNVWAVGEVNGDDVIVVGN